MRTECPSVMYSQVLKYELNDISFYKSYACLINIFNSFLKRGLFLGVFIFIQLSLRILPRTSFEKRNSFYALSYYAEHIYHVKKKLDGKCYSYRIL